MSTIFVSHHHTDNEVASTVRAWLKSQGHLSVFLDFDPADGFPAGCLWLERLSHELRSCRAVVALCSEKSMASFWCFAEVSMARMMGKPVLPIKIDRCVVHNFLTESQIIDLSAGDQEAQQRLQRGLLEAGLDPADAFDWDGSSPYPGLYSFSENNAAVFFGRDTEITDGLAVLNRMHRLGPERTLLVLGASGSGKSSYVRAGLLPRLRKDAEHWLVINPFRPSVDPSRSFAEVLSRAFSDAGHCRSVKSLYDALTKSPDDISSRSAFLVDLLLDLRRLTGHSEARVLLVVDQLEELLVDDDDQSASPSRPEFLAVLRAATESLDSPALLLATLREDFVAEFQSKVGPMDRTCESQHIGPLTPAKTAQVIEKPAQVAGVELGPGLVHALVADSADCAADAGLPLLAFTLQQLLERFGADRQLAIEDYVLLGGIQGAIARVADGVIKDGDLAPVQITELRKSFLAMVRNAEGGRWATQPVRWDHLPPSIHPVMERFVREGLLVVRHDNDERVVEVAHAVLLRSWELLAGWVDDNAAALRLRHVLRLAAQSWRESGDDSELWREGRLARAIELADGVHGDVVLTANDRAFVAAAQVAEQAEEEQRRRNQRRTKVFAVLAAVFSVFITVLFFRTQAESHRANAAQEVSDRTAEEARRNAAAALAQQARALAPRNSALALAVSAEASGRFDAVETRSSLLDAFLAYAQTPGHLKQSLAGHSGAALGVAINHDGTLAATAGADGAALVWDLSSGRLRHRLTRNEHAVRSVAFTPNGEVLAAAGDDGTVRLWKVSSGEQLREFGADPAGVNAIAFRPDGEVLAAAGDDGMVRLWKVSSGEQLREFGADPAGVNAIAFRPDGEMLATAGGEGRARLYDPATGVQLEEFVNRGNVRTVVFDPGGTVVATAGEEGIVRIWNLATGQEQRALAEHNADVTAVTFSHNGRLLATAGADQKVVLWDPSTGNKIATLVGRSGINGVSFNHDDTLIATASNDGNADLWNPSTDHVVLLPGHSKDVRQAVFSEDGSLAATASDDGTVRLWNASNGEALHVLHGHTDGANAVAFSSDGRLATSGDDGTVRLWNANTGKEARAFDTKQGAVHGLAFNPDNSLLATAGEDKTVRLWDPETGEERRTLWGHQELAYSVAFSPDGRLLASTSWDGTVRLWESASGREIGKLELGANVGAVAFSPNSERLAAGTWNSEARVWDLPHGGQQVARFIGHNGAVNAITFNSDGTLLATGSGDGIVRFWNPASGELVATLSGDRDDDVFGLAVSRDGTRMLRAGAKKTILLRGIVRTPADACKLIETEVTASELRSALGGDEPQVCTNLS
jgi:WD40 repeat protein